MPRDSRLKNCFTLEHRADVPLGCRGCTMETHLECEHCSANPHKLYIRRKFLKLRKDIEDINILLSMIDYLDED